MAFILCLELNRIKSLEVIKAGLIDFVVVHNCAKHCVLCLVSFSYLIFYTTLKNATTLKIKVLYSFTR